MQTFKEFCKDTIFTYEWSEFCDRTYMTECLPDDNMVVVATRHSNDKSSGLACSSEWRTDTKRHNGTHHDTL